MSSTKYSILIPAYKSQFFAEALLSVREQTYSDFQCVVVDDCSPEELQSIFEDVVGDDPRFEYYRNESNYGAFDVVDNWNKSLSYAKGEYVICMGDDDRLYPWCLEEYNQLIDKHPRLDVYHTRTEIINEKGEFVGLQESRPEWESAYSALWHQCHCKRIQYLGDFLFRTSSLKSEGGFFKIKLAVFSDNITSIRAAQKYGIANTQKICFQYRDSGYTITKNSHPRILAASIKNAYDWFLSFLQDNCKDEDDYKFRKLLLDNSLRQYMYGMMMSVVERDLQREGCKVFDYWREQCENLGIERWQMNLRLKTFRREIYKKKIKALFRF